MAWVVLISNDDGYARAYNSEAEARHAAEAAAQTAGADAWVVVANQATSAAWVIKAGSVRE
jgi:broad specificity polyphosphatase/5'/3'-nucleotidase SurE